MKKIILLLAISLKLSLTHPTTGKIENETDGEKSRKIIGQSVVTSVSVVMNGNEEPQFTDAVGKTVPRPFVVPPNVASPINLLNPDRYEFYTFNEKGDLVKRLMTLREIQSIVANGNGALISDNDPHESSQSVILNTIPLSNNHDNSDTKVQDIVDNVQNVLSREMENNKNLSNIPQDLLDTPNVSSSWSMILPAIFGNTGDEILPHKPINMTPETEVIDDITSTTTTTTKRIPSSKMTTTRATTKPPITKASFSKISTSTTVPLQQTTKVEQKITQSSSKNQKKPSTTTTSVATKSPTTTKKQTVKHKPKPLSAAYRSTTRRPIAPITSNNLPSIKESQYDHTADETTKTVLITSRPFVSTSVYTMVSTTPTTTRRPIASTTRKSTTNTVRRPITSSTTINKVPASSLVKDSEITKIEMKPIIMVESKIESNSSSSSNSENESKHEKVTQAPTSTILSTISKISSTSRKPSSTISSSSISTTTKIPLTSWSATKHASSPNSKVPSSSPTVLITTTHPLTTEQHKTSTISMSPVKLETFETRKPTTVAALVPTSMKLTTNEKESTMTKVFTTATVTKPPVSTASSSDELQDLAISQIIGSLKNDNFNLNHLFKPFDDTANEKQQQVTTTVTPIEEDDNTEGDDDLATTTERQQIEQEMAASIEESLEKSAEDINHVPDRVYINNQLYIDEKDPIVKEIPTTTEVMVSQSNEENEDEDVSTIESDDATEDPLTSTAVTNEEDEQQIMSTTKKDDMLLDNNSEVMQAIEQLLQEQHKSKNKYQSENLDVLDFDEDDETEIKLSSTLNSKKNLTQSEFITKAATVASIINTKFIEKHTTTTETPISDESDTTIPTILSEALSSVIEQMLREQELRKSASTSSSTISSTVKTTEFTTPTTQQQTTTQTSSIKNKEEATEPSLDDLNKLLYHYQELSSNHDELESFSLLRENDASETKKLERGSGEETTTTSDFIPENLDEFQADVKEKSSAHGSKIFSEIDSTTTSEPPLETTTTTDFQEFTTFFYVSDENSVEDDDSNLGAFTTEQYVATEKRISDRKTEDFATTNSPSSSEEDDDDDIVVQNPVDLVSSVLNAIGLTNSDEEEEEEKTTTTAKTENYENATEKNIPENTTIEKSTSESEEESDEVESAISSITSTLDKTLTDDIKTDFSLTSKIADSLISVADSISETLTENVSSADGENESDESTDKLITTTSIPQEEVDEREKLMTASEENERVTETTMTHFDTTSSTFSKFDNKNVQTQQKISTTLASTKKIRPRLPAKHNKQNKENILIEKDSSSPMIQLSIIRKEESLEQMDTIQSKNANIPTAATSAEGNFIKIENIDMPTTTSAPKLSALKNIVSNDEHEKIKPIYISQLSTIKTNAAFPEKQNHDDGSIEEAATERVPLIEKATKETTVISTSKLPIIVTTKQPAIAMVSDEDLVQIEVQTKSPVVENKIITTTISNAQSIKNTIKNTQQQQHSVRPATPIDLSSSSQESLGLAASTAHLSSDLSDFSKLCNELAFTFWKSITADGISQSRSVIISPFALTSTLSMVFLGARGQTSGEMNDLLKLDDMVTFNPHVVFRNISESIEQSRNSGIAAAAFARELYSDRSKGKLLPYFKEKAQQFYGAHVEEVNFNVINDILRRRTNLLVKRHTYNKIKEYLKTNNIWVNEPLAAVSANVFMTDCSKTTNSERDGEMFFQVSPAIRQRRLVPIPAAVYRSGFTAGYDPILDATAVAFGDELQSTILVMPGQQGSLLPGDNLERLENAFLESNNSWERLLTTFMERPGLEVQIPRFSHRSLINTTFALQQMGLKDIFDANKADLRGLTGATSSDLYFSDLIQINQFTTCGEDKIGDSHHIEIYPSPALKKGFMSEEDEAKFEMASSSTSIESNMQYKSLFYDPIYDSRYINVPLSLRPRQARLPENPRLRFDRPFLYFVRHNPTNIILFMGRFNPRLLP